MSSTGAGFIIQQVDFYKRNIAKFGLNDDIKSRIDNELNALAQQLDKIFETNKNQLQNTITELQNLRVSANKLTRDLSRTKTLLEDAEKKFALKEVALNNQLNNNQATIIQLTNENTELKKKLSNTTKELDKVRTNIGIRTNSTLSSEPTKPDTLDEAEKLKRKITSLERNVQNLDENVKKQEIVLKTKENEIDILQTEKNELKRKKDQNTLIIDNYEQKSVSIALTSQKNEEKELIDIQNQNITLRKDVENLVNANNTLQNTVNNLEKDKDVYLSNIDKLEQQKREFASINEQLSNKNRQLDEVNKVNQDLQSNLFSVQELVKKIQTELTLKPEHTLELEKLLEEKTKQLDQIQDQLAKVSSLYHDLSTSDTNFQDNSLALFNIYVTLVEKLYDGKVHGRILFLLHSPKESWTRKEITQATSGFMPAIILKAIHDLANAGIIYWDENTETIRLIQRFLD